MSLCLRPATSMDAGQTGMILWEFMDQIDWMPSLYSGAETISFCSEMIDRGWMTVAEKAGRVAGFLAQTRNEVNALYLTSDMRGQGIGARLLGDAKSKSNALTLWTYQANSGAERFYKHHGFLETGRSDGADNEENLPAIQFRWTQRDQA